MLYNINVILDKFYVTLLVEMYHRINNMFFFLYNNLFLRLILHLILLFLYMI